MIPAVIILDFERSYSCLQNNADKVRIMFFCGTILDGVPSDCRDQKRVTRRGLERTPTSLLM